MHGQSSTRIERLTSNESSLFASATTLLTVLANPLNVTLLSSQLLSASSIWARPNGLRTTLRILGIFSNAARHVAQQDKDSSVPTAYPLQRILSKEDWASAVIKGAGESSPRWRHLCILAGLLIGFEGAAKGVITGALRATLETAIVKAVNLSFRSGETQDEFAANSIALMLSHASDLLGDGEKANLDIRLLLPILYHAPFLSKDGLHLGYFLSTMDADVTQVTRSKFDWSSKSATYVQCQRMATGPIMSCLSPLSRLISFSVQQIHEYDVLAAMVKDLSAFTRSLTIQWRQNKLSEIDLAEETDYLSDESLHNTLPLLWQTLRSTMFALIVIFRSLLSRVMEDSSVSLIGAPFLAIQTLHTLRNLYFISSRMGQSSFSQYQFVTLTAIDILSQYSVEAEAFLKDIQPTSQGQIAQHPHDRCQDLFFLNTAEHLASILSPQANEVLLIGAAKPYLGLGEDPRLLEVFEAAHSVMLAVFSAPQNLEILMKHIHPYIDALFKVFPHAISARQFRMAIKTLVRVTSPPFPIAETEPMLPSTVLQLVRTRLESGTAVPLQRNGNETSSSTQEPILSEQSACQLALIDSLPMLPADQLEDWLPLVAEGMSLVQDPVQSQICEQRFWAVISNGEMDVDRAALCVSWWGTRGGRELITGGDQVEQEGPLVGGALTETSKL